MLYLYKRHTATCPHREKGRRYTRCSCPWWVDGVHLGEDVRFSCKTSVRAEAERQLERFRQGSRDEGLSVEVALQRWLADVEARQLASSTTQTCRRTAALFGAACKSRGIRQLSQITQEDIAADWQTWQCAPMTAYKRLERYSSFLHFCVDRGWIGRNPMTRMRKPRVEQMPTMPFTRSEFATLLAACDSLEHSTAHIRAKQARCLLLVMRYTGLRISDAIRLSDKEVEDGAVLIKQEKTRVFVRVPIPQNVIEELARCPRVGSVHYFWTGVSQWQTAVKVWTETLSTIYQRSGLPTKAVNRVAHRCRDTFAVELLLAGVPLERVSRLLGHTSIRTTEKHYAPWVQERQEQAEEDVRRAWGAPEKVINKEVM